MRDQLLAAVTARLERIEAAQDLAPALEPGALDETQRLAEVLRDDDGDRKARFMLGWLHWYRCQGLPKGQDRDALKEAIQAFTLCFIRGVEGLPEPLLPSLAEKAGEVAFTWLEQAQDTTNLTLITATVLLWRRIVASTRADHPDRAEYLHNLALAMRIRYGRTGSLEDLKEAIKAGREAVDSAFGDHPGQTMFLYNLGAMLWARFERTSNPEDLEEAIIAYRRVVDSALTNDPDRAMYLTALGVTLHCRFRQTGAQADLDEAITAGRAAVETSPGDHPDRAKYLSNLSAALRDQFERTGVQVDLDEAITIGRAAVETSPGGHPDRAICLCNLCHALRIRFEQTGVQADLDEAVTIGRAAVEATPGDHPHRAACLSNLGSALEVRFEQVGALVDLDEAIVTARAAVEATPMDHINQVRYLYNLGNALIIRFERMDAQADLDEAIITARAAVKAIPTGDPHRGSFLSSLGVALRVRFERLGALADLDEAITTGRAAVEATPTGHPYRAMCLSNLGGAVRCRFERTGAHIDLDQAITLARAAVEATQTDHLNRAMYLSNLSGALHARFERRGVLADLDEAIVVGRQAVHAAPDDHPERAKYLTIVSNALGDRFRRTGTRADLDEAINAGRQCLQAVPDGHPLRATCLSNFGITLRVHAKRTGAQTDLDEAIATSRAAVGATPIDHPDRAMRLCNLGVALRTRGTQADLDEAITTYVQAAEVMSGAPSVRIDAAWSAASLAVQTSTRRAAGLLETAVRLLPETASRRLDRGDQQYALAKSFGLASDAAALALADDADSVGEEPAVRALRLLELGHGVMLSQALDTRSDLTDLHARHPALAARFIALRDQLDQVGDTSVLAGDARVSDGWGEHRVEDRHQLAAQFTVTVAEIRGLDGFETFLLPPEPDRLMRLAEHGPVVVINVSRYRSDAILLRPEGITSIPLPDFVRGVVIDRIRTFHQALGAAHDSDASSHQRSDAQDALDEVLGWLWDAAAWPILDKLGYQHTPAPGTTWPRVWWVSGGIVGFLPVHAAGHHREPPGPDGRHTVMDRVISSYTPTVRALGYARERATASAADARALIVAMPTTPGIDSPLRHVVTEADLVHAQLPGSTLLIEEPAATEADLPTRATVVAHLSECAIAHFACHGSSHPVDPSQNLLLLHDHEIDPLTVTSLASIRLDQARLAYLSACRTAFNPSTDLADEAIHLTTAFQLAGYPHVVGTFWEIDDALAVRVADTFYTALATGPNMIDTRGAAQALHHAVRAIRDELPGTPSLWAAYLHAGA